MIALLLVLSAPAHAQTFQLCQNDMFVQYSEDSQACLDKHGPKGATPDDEQLKKCGAEAKKKYEANRRTYCTLLP